MENDKRDILEEFSDVVEKIHKIRRQSTDESYISACNDCLTFIVDKMDEIDHKAMFKTRMLDSIWKNFSPTNCGGTIPIAEWEKRQSATVQ